MARQAAGSLPSSPRLLCLHEHVLFVPLPLLCSPLTPTCSAPPSLLYLTLLASLARTRPRMVLCLAEAGDITPGPPLITPARCGSTLLEGICQYVVRTVGPGRQRPSCTTPTFSNVFQPCLCKVFLVHIRRQPEQWGTRALLWRRGEGEATVRVGAQARSGPSVHNGRGPKYGAGRQRFLLSCSSQPLGERAQGVQEGQGWRGS